MSIDLTVVIPTINGREESLQRTLQAYADTTRVPYEVIIERGYSCWPAACNAGAAFATGDVIHFGADDLCPHGDWYNDAVRATLAADELPAPCLIWNHEHGGNVGSDDGGNGALARFTRVPIMTRDQCDRIGAWPELIYFADLWVSDRGRSLGMETRCVAGYEFVHHWSEVGRLDGVQKELDDAYAEYQALAGNLGN